MHRRVEFLSGKLPVFLVFLVRVAFRYGNARPQQLKTSGAMDRFLVLFVAFEAVYRQPFVCMCVWGGLHLCAGTCRKQTDVRVSLHC